MCACQSILGMHGMFVALCILKFIYSANGQTSALVSHARTLCMHSNIKSASGSFDGRATSDEYYEYSRIPMVRTSLEPLKHVQDRDSSNY